MNNTSLSVLPPMPHPTPTTEPFWQGLAEEKLMLQQCDDCKEWVFYPRTHCSHCLSSNLEWQQVSGEGEIYSFTIARRPTAPPFAGMEPQYIAVVQLQEGVRMNTVIANATESDLKVGVRVKPCFVHTPDAQTLLYFELA
ncbi:MAG: Zn-ribbon domain-containing OB-fold protein [Pseudomonadaceae bacterium]|nr:Zn-ribbon domain-containing OB-fold protein [Pseudomonadaceae bacterium]